VIRLAETLAEPESNGEAREDIRSLGLRPIWPASIRDASLCFVLCGLAAALAGVLLAGYSTKAHQGMGDAFLLPSIAAVVIGGTNILGGRGRYLGTLVGVVLIVLLNSVLSITEMPEAGRQVIYGLVIIMMLLAYGRGERVTS
jgi:ribose transport system permease protein